MIDRRGAIGGLGALAAAGLAAKADARPRVKPPFLNPGDTVGVVAPASAVGSDDGLDRAEWWLRGMGLVPKFGPHAGGSYGYRFTNHSGRTIVYSTDSEHKIDDMAREADFVRFFEDADLVICDTMYSLAKTSTTKEHSGHSSNVVAIDLCRQAQAKRLALFHHDPLHDDDDIQQLHEDSIRYEELTRDGPPLEVLCAYDGLDVTV